MPICILARSDLLFNTSLLIRGIHDIFKGNYAHLCLVVSFLIHLAELLSACYTVAFTIQLYTAHRRSPPILSLLFIFVFSSIFCFTLCHRNTYVECHEELKLIWFMTDVLFSFVIPFSLILIYNIRIVNFIRKHLRSPISIQSTLMRKRQHSRSNDKIYNLDDTFDIDNNLTNSNGTCINTDENQNIETNFKQEDPTASVEIKHQRKRSSISSLFDRSHPDKSLSHSHFQPGFRPFVLSKLASHFKKNILSDSFSNPLSRKLSYQSNDKEFFSQTLARACQSIRVTRMLVLVSICFLILKAPAHLCVIALKIYTSVDASVFNDHNDIDLYLTTKKLTTCEVINYVSRNEINNLTKNDTILSLFQHDRIMRDPFAIHLFYVAILLTQSMAYASYSIIFFLYSFSGIAFRKSLRQFINTFTKR
ncbi:unnamed protein product [Rotaria socialis]